MTPASRSPGNGFRTTLPDARLTPRFAGVASFCRFPLIENIPDQQKPVDWALYGIPYDGGVTYRPGAKFAPRAIREASQYIKPYHLEHDINIAQVLSLADAGDTPVEPYSCKATLAAAAAFARTIGDPTHTRLFAIGGDHSIAYANIKATWERMGKPSTGLPLLHFDAHLDTVDSVWGEKWTHASPFIRAIEDGLINPKKMLSLGIRGPLNSAADLDYAKHHGIEIIPADRASSPETLIRLQEFIRQQQGDPVYLTFDIDCIDPAFAPGTGTPCCGGLTTPQAFTFLRACAGINLAGADLVELLPDRDPAGITSLLCSHLILEILALSALSPSASS